MQVVDDLRPGRPLLGVGRERTSSVAVRPARRARSCASTSKARGKPCGVWARQRRSRATVRVTRRRSSAATSLIVSVTGTAAIAATPVRTSRMTASMTAVSTKGRAACVAPTMKLSLNPRSPFNLS